MEPHRRSRPHRPFLLLLALLPLPPPPPSPPSSSSSPSSCRHQTRRPRLLQQVHPPHPRRAPRPHHQQRRPRLLLPPNPALRPRLPQPGLLRLRLRLLHRRPRPLLRLRRRPRLLPLPLPLCPPQQLRRWPPWPLQLLRPWGAPPPLAEERWRDGVGEAVAAEVDAVEVGQLGERRRDGAGEGVEGEVEDAELGERAHEGRHGARHAGPGDGEIEEIGEPGDFAYDDGSITTGDFATETLTFTDGSRVALGCGLVDRTSSSANPTSRSSSITFGSGAVGPSVAASFTPMVKNPRMETFYYVQLIGISVGGARVPGVAESDLRLDPSTGRGGVIVDSGTSVTRLARPAYSALRDAFRAAAAGLRLSPGGFSLFDTCYDLSRQKVVKVPTVSMHFAGGAEAALPPENYLIPVDSRGTFCFAFAGTDGGVSIIGNIQQQGFRVVFDGDGQRVGFVPKGC